MEEKKLTDEELNDLIERIEYESWAQNSLELSQAAYMLKYQNAEIERLTEENAIIKGNPPIIADRALGKTIRMKLLAFDQMKEQNAELQKQVDELKKRLHWIWAIGVDYDGCDGVKSLKELIDEMVELTQIESKDLDEYFTYNTTQGGKINILSIVRKVERKEMAQEIEDKIQDLLDTHFKGKTEKQEYQRKGMEEGFKMALEICREIMEGKSNGQ